MMLHRFGPFIHVILTTLLTNQIPVNGFSSSRFCILNKASRQYLFYNSATSKRPHSQEKSQRVVRFPKSRKCVEYKRTSLNSFSIEYSSVISTISAFCESSPYAAALVSGSLQGSAADLVAQKTQMIKKKESNNDTAVQSMKGNFAFQRNIAFLLYGGLYGGCAQELLYNRFLPLVFGTDASPLTVISKVVVDLLIFTPFLSLPSAYMTKATVYGESFKNGLDQYFNDVRKKGLLIKSWTLWGPVQCLTFSVIPVHLRISFVAAVSFIWLVILSILSSSES